MAGMSLMREIEILKQSYLSKRSTFPLHPDEIPSERVRDYIERIDICVARILVEFEEERRKIFEKIKEDTELN